jgi:hypothetical protein
VRVLLAGVRYSSGPSSRGKEEAMLGTAILSLLVAGAISAVVVFAMHATGQYKK